MCNQFLTTSVVVFEAAIRANQCMIKSCFKQEKKRNMKNKFLHKSPSIVDGLGMLRRANARGNSDIYHM